MRWGSVLRSAQASLRGLLVGGLLISQVSAAAEESSASDAGADTSTSEAFGVDAGPDAQARLIAGSQLDGESATDQGGLEALLSEPVISAASRTAESASDAPGTIWTISGTDLKRFGIQSIEEAIRYLGHGMTSYEYDARQNTAFGARGYMSDNLGLHFAVLIDGNQAGGSTKTSRGAQTWTLPIELIDHLEVVIGPGAVLYGSSAMLGVVNVITKSAASVTATQVFAQANGGLPVDKWAKDITWGEAWVRAGAFGAQSIQLRDKPFDLTWHFALRWDRQQGRSVWHGVDNVDPFDRQAEAFNREDVFNRDAFGRVFARATWSKWQFLAWVAASTGTGTGPISGSGKSSYFEPEYGLDAMWSTEVGSAGDLSLRAHAIAFDSQVRTGDWPANPQKCLAAVDSPSCSSTVNYLQVNPYLEALFSWDWNKDGSQVTTFGAQAFFEASFITTGTVANDGSKQQRNPTINVPLPNGALFAQHIWRGRFGNLNLGARGDLGFLGSAFSPRLAYGLSPWENGTLKLIFSTAFRTPTITERFLEIDGFLTSNPEILPERVYSAELDLAQRFGLQHIQLAVFAVFWRGLITIHSINSQGGSINQFANLRNVWSAGVNVGVQGGESDGFSWALSVNYAPGRVMLPRDIAQSTDQELKDMRLSRAALDGYSSTEFGSVFLPNEGMPDFYATGHLSLSLGANLPRLSLAANLNSPRLRMSWAGSSVALDPRFAPGPFLPWSVDARAAVESDDAQRVGWRLVFTGRSLPTGASPPRIGAGYAPLPEGGIGAVYNPIARFSAMAEINARF